MASAATARAKVRPASTARLAGLFHALSDETRLRLVQELLQGERCVCELTDALDAAQSRLSFHLKALRDAGLVTDRREGRWTYYALVPDAVAELVTFCGTVCDRARACAQNINET